MESSPNAFVYFVLFVVKIKVGSPCVSITYKFALNSSTEKIGDALIQALPGTFSL